VSAQSSVFMLSVIYISKFVLNFVSDNRDAQTAHTDKSFMNQLPNGDLYFIFASYPKCKHLHMRRARACTHTQLFRFYSNSSPSTL